MTPTPT